MIPSNFKGYFYSNYLMSPHGDNDILYLTEYVKLNGTGIGVIEANLAINCYYNSITKTFHNIDGSSISLDNYDAIMCLSKHFYLNYHKKFRWGHQNLCPWDLLFYLHISESYFNWLGTLFLWIPSIWMIISILTSSAQSTSTALLTWIKLQSFNLPITKWICNKLVKFKVKSWYTYFENYFKDSNHPNRILASILKENIKE